MSGVSSQKRLSLFLMATALLIPVCVVEICVISKTRMFFSIVGIIVVFAITVGSISAFTTCTEPLICCDSVRFRSQTFTVRTQGMSIRIFTTLSSKSSLYTITMSTSEDGIISPVRELPYSYPQPSLHNAHFDLRVAELVVDDPRQLVHRDQIPATPPIAPMLAPLREQNHVAPQLLQQPRVLRFHQRNALEGAVGLDGGLCAVLDRHGAVEQVVVDEVHGRDGDLLDGESVHGAPAR